MSIKIKISIIAICFALVAAVCIGFVFAAPNETITMNGNVSYEVAKATLTVSPNDPDLGSTTGSGSETGSGEYVIGETVTLTAETKSGSTFLAWATSTNPNTMEILSTSTSYSFELTEDSPTTYFALFNKTTSTGQTVGNLKYTFYNEAKLASVTDTTSDSLSGAFEIPSVVSGGENSYKVYSIGNDAFRNCSSLTSITIPEGVTSIGSEAFRSCSSLTSITIPEGVTSIGYYAFRVCSSLAEITINGNISTLSSNVFQSCTSLTKLTLGAGATSIPSNLFSPNMLTRLNEIVVEAGSTLNAKLPTYGTWVKDGGSGTVTNFDGPGTYTRQP